MMDGSLMNGSGIQDGWWIKEVLMVDYDRWMMDVW
jgi:hypothetical protein